MVHQCTFSTNVSYGAAQCEAMHLYALLFVVLLRLPHAHFMVCYALGSLSSTIVTATNWASIGGGAEKHENKEGISIVADHRGYYRYLDMNV